MIPNPATRSCGLSQKPGVFHSCPPTGVYFAAKAVEKGKVFCTLNGRYSIVAWFGWGFVISYKTPALLAKL